MNFHNYRLSYEFTKIEQIDTSRNPLTDADLLSIINGGKPILLKGFTDGWPCTNWQDLEYLDRRLNGIKLPVTIYIKSFFDLRNLTGVHLTVKDYVQRMLLDQNEKSYMATNLIQRNNHTHHTINNDINDLFYSNSIESRSFLFGKNTITNMHYHRKYESFIHQIQGYKDIFLCSSNLQDFYQFKPNPWYSKYRHWSTIDLSSATTPEKFYSIAKKMNLNNIFHATLGPTDSIFIPIYWWHMVYGKNITLSIVDFFDSSIPKKYFSYLGLRSCNHFNYK